MCVCVCVCVCACVGTPSCTDHKLYIHMYICVHHSRREIPEERGRDESLREVVGIMPVGDYSSRTLVQGDTTLELVITCSGTAQLQNLCVCVCAPYICAFALYNIRTYLSLCTYII